MAECLDYCGLQFPIGYCRADENCRTAMGLTVRLICVAGGVSRDGEMGFGGEVSFTDVYQILGQE